MVGANRQSSGAKVGKEEEYLQVPGHSEREGGPVEEWLQTRMSIVTGDGSNA